MRILLIEDNALNVDLFLGMLEDSGHEIVTANDGRSGRDAALSGGYDLVICDVRLPGLDGLSVGRELRAAGLTVPLIAVSAHAMAGDAQRGLDAGFDEYLTKPVSPRDLRAAIARVSAVHS